MSYYAYNPAYLVHHGILGQKWGVRRYQNEDGSLTDAGRKRYTSASEHSRRLNDLDKEKADHVYNLDKYGSMRNRYESRIERAEKKGDFAKSEKYKSKFEAADKKYSEYQGKIKDVNQRTQKAIQDAIDAGYDVNMKTCKRSPKTDRGKRFLANAGGLMLSAAIAVSPSPVVPVVIGTTSVPGYKYNVRQGADPNKGRITTTVKDGIHRNTFTTTKNRH